MTFDKLNELMNQLSEGDWTKYKEASAARKLMQKIKNECDVCRETIINECKKANPKLFKIKE